MWRYTNKTTGSQIECESLGFISYELRELRGIPVPETDIVTAMLRGKVDCLVTLEDGTIYDISIEEFCA
jgi:hypothetical protein